MMLLFDKRKQKSNDILRLVYSYHGYGGCKYIFSYEVTIVSYRFSFPSRYCKLNHFKL